MNLRTFFGGLGGKFECAQASKKRGHHIPWGVGGILGNHIFEDGVLDNWSEDMRPGRCLSCQVICEFDCGWIAWIRSWWPCDLPEFLVVDEASSSVFDEPLPLS